MLTSLALAASLWLQPPLHPEYRKPGTLIVCDFWDPGCPVPFGPLGPVIDPADHPLLSAADIRRALNNAQRRETSESLWIAAREAGDRADVPGISTSVSVEKISDAFAKDLFWVVGSRAGDKYSTAWSLHRGARELNPGGFNSEARDALSDAATATTVLALWKLRRDGHGKAATIIRYLYVAGHVVIVAWNINEGLKAGRR